jgi:hypothetical protein
VTAIDSKAGFSGEFARKSRLVRFQPSQNATAKYAHTALKSRIVAKGYDPEKSAFVVAPFLRIFGRVVLVTAPGKAKAVALQT